MGARDAAKGVLRRAGFDLARTGRGARRRTLAEALAHLRRMGVRPATVCDIGVGRGTPELYGLFPDARFLLVDPLEESREVMDRVLRGGVSGEAVVAAASATPGTLTLRVAPHDVEASTVLETPSGASSWEPRLVEAVPLDDLLAAGQFDAPFLLKVDVQGAELEVLRGATRTLRSAVAVALEVSLIQGYSGGPELAEVTAFMHGRGFAAFDIVAGVNRPHDGSLMFVDMIFVPQNGPLRASHAYSQDV